MKTGAEAGFVPARPGRSAVYYMTAGMQRVANMNELAAEAMSAKCEYLSSEDLEGRTPVREVPAECHSLSGAAELCKEFTFASGYNYFFFSFRHPYPMGTASTFTLTNYPEEWLELYQQRSYGRIDPVARRLKTAISPFTWASVQHEDAATHDLFREARGYGLDQGACFPFFGPSASHAAFTLAGGTIPPAGKSRDAFFAAASLFGQRIFESVLRAVSGLGTEQEPLLTARQQEILTGIAEGLSYREIAERHRIKQSTVKTLLDRCCSKLGVMTREEAIVKAVATGQIHPLRFPSSMGFQDAPSQVAGQHIRPKVD
ncbi:MAG: LuxR family transcriptional regulator [Nevskia sp.]|nr:LuxR family transcriptional regulator [Nevskia sp.]